MSLIRHGSLVVIFVLMALPLQSSRSLAAETVASVNGTVTLDGKPLPEGRIFFHVGDDRFVGTKIKEGGYKLTDVPTGAHKITIEFKGASPKYASEDQAMLRVEVTKGENQINLDLRSK